MSAQGIWVYALGKGNLMDAAYCKKMKFIYLFIDSNNLLIIEPQILSSTPLFIYDLCCYDSTDNKGFVQ